MRKGELTREAILDHAMNLATRVGLDGLTIGRLAADLEMSKSGLFAHFRSKELLQVQVLDSAARRFVERVIAPALRAPRGEPRVRALFERWLDWGRDPALPGGCIFVAASVELDDQPGPVRDRLVAIQRDWLETLAQAARIARREGHFRGALAPEQLAFELYGVALAYHHVSRLLADRDAEARARDAFEALLARARGEQTRPR